jgi:hypothetical protein
MAKYSMHTKTLIGFVMQGLQFVWMPREMWKREIRKRETIEKENRREIEDKLLVVSMIYIE